MKKILFFVSLACTYSFLDASTPINTVKNYTVQMNKRVKALTAKLTELQTELTKIKNQIPVEQYAVEESSTNSKKAADAVGGGTDDTRKAEKSAKMAASKLQQKN